MSAVIPYHRPPEFDGLVTDRDVKVATRDGATLCVDVYRPDTDRPLPALLAFAVYNKDLQGPDRDDALPPQPAWSPMWSGPLEAGDTRFFVSRGYVHVIGSPRGWGKSVGEGDRTWDGYDLIEWIAEQPWCDGNVGMVGISGYGAEQLHTARQHPPHLKAIFPFDPRGAYGVLGGFREEHPGGVISLFRYLIGHMAVSHAGREAPPELSEEREVLWRAAMANQDYQAHTHLYNVLTMKGQHMPSVFDVLIDPFEADDTTERSEQEIARIDIPTYVGSGWYAASYKTHLLGAQSYWRHLVCPKKLLLAGPAHLERPVHGFLQTEMLRWHDKWLKGIDLGVRDDPPVRFWVMGANEWRTAEDWPVPETQWTKLYLSSWERLRFEDFTPVSLGERLPPDSFVQMPLTQTRHIAGLRYLTDPLPHDMLVAGPAALTLFAAIDQTDTNWMVVLKDVGPDYSVRTAREGEWDIPDGLPERDLTYGWLKASNRALDPDRSLPWKPFHRLTRAAAEPVPPGEVLQYEIEILPMANQFKAGHRICLEIMSLDRPTGVAGATNVEYIPYHVASSRTTLHTVFHDAVRPSHLLLPLIPPDGAD